MIELPALDDYYAAGSRVALHRLERGLFEPCSDEDRIDPGEAVRLLEAGGERAEAELVAAEVLALLRSGVPGEEIVVCHRSPARVGPLFERVFGAFGIVAGVRAIGAVRAHRARAGLLALARCALLEDADACGSARVSAHARRARARRRSPTRSRLRCARAGPASLADARELLGWDLGELEAVRRDPFAELPRQARRLLAAPRARRGGRARGRRSRSTHERSRCSSGRWRSSTSSASAPGGAELIALLAELPVPAGGPPDAGRRAAGRAARDPRAAVPRGVRVRACAKASSRSASGPEPFLSDERRRELAAASGLRLAAREDVARPRALPASTRASRARPSGSCFSYRSSDEEGNLALPSPFIADVAELFEPEWRERRRTRLLADVVWPADEAPTERERLRVRGGRGGACRRLGEPPRRGTLLGGGARAACATASSLSAGALEAFADCPVRWLVERELQPERFEPEPDPLARGQLHARRCSSGCWRGSAARSRAASLPTALALLDELLAEVPTPIARRAGPRPVRAAALRSIEADLRRYLEHEARERPRVARRRGSSCGSGSDRRAGDRCRRCALGDATGSWSAA